MNRDGKKKRKRNGSGKGDSRSLSLSLSLLFSLTMYMCVSLWLVMHTCHPIRQGFYFGILWLTLLDREGWRRASLFSLSLSLFLSLSLSDPSSPDFFWFFYWLPVTLCAYPFSLTPKASLCRTLLQRVCLSEPVSFFLSLSLSLSPCSHYNW